jgi:predicted AlkP superfamily phosphohydrolase/phosphomutase
MFWLNFNLPDHMLHKCDFRFFRDVIHVEREVFAVIDKVIRKLRSESDALIIVSDHGFSEYRAAISVNDVLMKEGYIKLTGREAKALSDHSVLEKHGAMRKDIAWIRLPLPLLKLVSKPVILPTVRKLRDIFFKLTGKFIRLGFNVDLLNSRAFLESHSSFGVSVKDATDVDKVKELLSRVDGIEWVKRREELYSGPYLNRSNELLVKPKFDEGYTLAAINIYGSTHIYGRYTGHHPDGVLVVDSDIPDKRLVDGIDRLENYVVAPLVMWLMDQPLPSDTDALPMLKKITGEENFRFRADYVSKWRLIKRLAAMRSKIRS